MTWRPSPQPPCEPGCTCGPVKPADTGAGTTRRPVPHPLGGITYRMDPSQAAQWWEDTDPDPVPGGGDKLPGHGKARPLKREPGGVSTQSTNNGLPNRKATT